MYQVFYFYYFYNILLNEKMNCPYYKSSSFFWQGMCRLVFYKNYLIFCWMKPGVVR